MKGEEIYKLRYAFIEKFQKIDKLNEQLKETLDIDETVSNVKIVVDGKEIPVNYNSVNIMVNARKMDIKEALEELYFDLEMLIEKNT